MGEASKFRIQSVVVLGIAAMVVAAAVRTRSLALPNIRDVGFALTFVVVMAAAYEKLLWKWIPPGRPPRLYGTWKMLLEPEKGPKGASLDKKPCYLSIDQTASTIEANLLFADGQSTSTAAVLGVDGPGKHLFLFYDYKPHKKSKDEPDRKGAAALRITANGLRGRYWNDIGIRGDLTSEARTKKMRYEEFDQALEGKYN